MVQIQSQSMLERIKGTLEKSDAVLLKNKITKPINLEMAPTNDMLNFALKLKPKYVCIVPEKRKELTTEGGLNLKNKNLFKIINKLKKKNIEVSLFINPNFKDVNYSFKLGADAVEIHTGNFAKATKDNNRKKIFLEFNKIKKCEQVCIKKKVKFNLGHGLDYRSTKYLMKLKNVNELNIGHFIIGESIFEGLSKVIKNFKKIIK